MIWKRAGITKTAFVIRHLLFEDLGILDPLLRENGHDIRCLDAGLDPIDQDEVLGVGLLVVLGCLIGVGDQKIYPFLVEEIHVTSQRGENGLPTIVVCFGAQLIVAAFVAAVRPTGRVEIGYAPLMLAQLQTIHSLRRVTRTLLIAGARADDLR